MAVEIDRVRLLAGDSDPDNQLFSDDQISLIIGNEDSSLLAAAAVADAAAAQYARRASISIDGASFQYNQIAENYRVTASRLRTQDASTVGEIGAPYVGGISKSDEQTQRDNTDREPSRFEVGQQDFPGGVPPRPFTPLTSGE